MKWNDIPRGELEKMTISDAAKKGVDWGDCYPVCYGDDLGIDDVLGSNGRLLWGNGTGDDLVSDESCEYVRPNAEEEEEEKQEEEDE